MLTSRQQAVMLLAAKGLSNKEIARRLEITEGTVKVHLRSIFVKLGIRNRTMLVALAAQKSR
jgi:two-component system nitrate/nitrite response regulator NarL